MIRFKLKQVVLSTLLMVATLSPTFAQSGEYYTVRDLEVWASAQFKYKINKQWSASFEEQFRWKDDASTIDQYFTEIGIERKLNKAFSIGFAGRYIRENDTEGKIQGYENHFRWNTDLVYRQKFKHLSLKYRVRYQSRNELGISNDANAALRFRVKSEYNFKNWKFDPRFSAEIFNSLDSENEFYKLRMTVGTSYEFKNIGELGAFYRIEEELTGIYPKTTNIIGIQYKYTLKYKKNEK
jgi:hypothetical protein